MFAEEEEQERPPIPQPERAEAKVVYQYPQGRFRFPLIPDDQPREEQKQPQRLVDGEERGRPLAARQTAWRGKRRKNARSARPMCRRRYLGIKDRAANSGGKTNAGFRL